VVKTPKQKKKKSGSVDAVVTLDRRSADRRRGGDRRVKQEPVAVERRELERRVKVQRRRQIDPTTCERDYTDDEVEFMQALDRYKRVSGRMFPTCSELLEVLRGLGYVKQTGGSAPCVAESSEATTPVSNPPL
jgi:hypothetical protein